MKKTFLLFAMLASVASSAQRTIPVTIANTKVDYSTKIVTFDLSWKGSDANHRNEVWVFVDIRPVTGVNTLGSWSPATLVPNSTTVTAGSGNQYTSLTHTVVSGNTRGVWVKGTSSVTTNTFNATVKVTLAAATPAKFNACAYATDYPPNAASYSSGTYTLKGTQPFTVTGNGTLQGNKYVGTSITSLTDATGCPGGIGRDVINNGTCLPHLTAVGGYCRDLVADGASTYTGCGREIKYVPGSFDYVLNNGCATGWRWANVTESKCIYNHKGNIGLSNLWFWVNGSAECWCNPCSTWESGLENCDDRNKAVMALFSITNMDACLSTCYNRAQAGHVIYVGNKKRQVICVR